MFPETWRNIAVVSRPTSVATGRIRTFATPQYGVPQYFLCLWVRPLPLRYGAIKSAM